MEVLAIGKAYIFCVKADVSKAAIERDYANVCDILVRLLSFISAMGGASLIDDIKSLCGSIDVSILSSN